MVGRVGMYCMCTVCTELVIGIAGEKMGLQGRTRQGRKDTVGRGGEGSGRDCQVGEKENKSEEGNVPGRGFYCVHRGKKYGTVRYSVGWIWNPGYWNHAELISRQMLRESA